MENQTSKTKSALKALLRPPARLAYQMLRPLLRPMFFRLRTFFTEGLRQQLVQTQHDVRFLQHELRETRAELVAAGLRLTTDLIKEIQATRDFLEADVLDQGERVARLAEAMRERLDVFGMALREGFPLQLDRIEAYALASARRFAIPCEEGEVLVRTEAGYVLCSAQDRAVLAALIDSGDLERGTRLLIQRLVGPGDVFIDVGANLGMHTLAAARAMQGRGRIIAFEPFPGTAELLRKTVLLNGFAGIVEIHTAAVSTATGTRTLYLGEISGHHSLYPLASGGVGKVDVPLIRVDTVVGDTRPVRLVKIDVEGAELEVLETVGALIERNPGLALIVEFGPSHLRRTGVSTQAWFAAFRRYGLDFRAIEPLTGALEACTIEELEARESSNLLFARAGLDLLQS